MLRDILREVLLWDFTDKNQKLLVVWTYLLMNAATEEGIQNGVPVKKGELVTSYRKIASDLGLTVNEVRTALVWFTQRITQQTTHPITQQTTHQFTHITICNYESYEYLLHSKSHTQSHSNSHSNSLCDSHTKDKENNNEEEVKEKREKEDFLPLEPLLFQEKEINKENEEEEKTKETELILVADATLSAGADAIDFKQIANLWNSICGTIFPPIQKLTQSRKDKIKVRVREIQKDGGDYIEILTKVFTMATQSSFFREKWHPKFDWFFENDKNYVKVLEGNYNSNPIDLNGNTDEARAARFARGEQFLAEQREREKAFVQTFGTILD